MAFNRQGLETTELLVLLLSRGFTPGPSLLTGRMKPEAEPDGISLG